MKETLAQLAQDLAAMKSSLDGAFKSITGGIDSLETAIQASSPGATVPDDVQTALDGLKVSVSQIAGITVPALPATAAPSPAAEAAPSAAAAAAEPTAT